MPVSVPVGGGPVEHVEVRRGEYHDSVTLMLAGRAVGGVAGVERVLVAMATELNAALLAELGYAARPEAGPGDLIVALTSDDEACQTAALHALADALTPAASPVSPDGQPGGSITAPGHSGPNHPAPRTTAAALGRTSAPITLISTPGLASVAEAMESLEYGASPIIFSDNIPIHHEVRLKEEARRRGLLVMGPDCGTVVLHGTGLAFANITRPGPISLVAASGTGAQELMALLDAANTGIHHCLGVGGRDLTEQVAGRSTLAALTALAEDPETELIAVVSKPPHPAIATRIQEHAATLGKPVHFAFVGTEHPTLTESAERILTALGREVPPAWPRWAGATAAMDATAAAEGRAPTVRGLFSGGTLRAEAEVVLTRAEAEMALTRAEAEMALTRAEAEAALTRAEAEAALTRAGGRKIDNGKSGGWGEGESREPQESTEPHTAPFTFDLTDFGDDTYTRGRPHPMIDNTLRLRAVADAADDAGVGVLLLDVVLGRGAHADPASEIAAAIAAARQRRPELAVAVSVCGTAGDPQGLVRQAEALAGAGAWVFLSNAEAAGAAARLALGGLPDGAAERP
jgi:FdrA protein